MPADNPYGRSSLPSGPAISAIAVTPHDTNDLPSISRSIYVGGAGNLTVIMAGDTASVTFTGLPIGLYPFAVARVLATGTTATNIVAVR